MAASGPKESIDGGKAWYQCDPPMNLGEAPIYRASDSTLHWVDCLCEPPELHILKIEPDTGDAQGRARVLRLEDSVTVAFFRRNHPGSYICAYYQGVAFLDEATGRLDIVKEIIPTSQRDLLRFNDGGVDAKGRFGWPRSTKKPWLMDQTSYRPVMGSQRVVYGGMIQMEVCMRWKRELSVAMVWLGARTTRPVGTDPRHRD